MPAPSSARSFLSIAATSSRYGIEGFHLKDVLGVVAAGRAKLLETRPANVDVETRGELTRGMAVIDQRPWSQAKANVELATHVDGQGVRDYLKEVLLS